MSTKAELIDIYKQLEGLYKPFGKEVGTYSTPVNFKESLSVPIHRWYAYKEGFSPSFVRNFINSYSKSDDDVVFDPFGGIGTTGLEAILLNHPAYSMDVNPLGIFATRVKTNYYNSDEVEKLLSIVKTFNSIDDYSISCEINNATVESYFSPTTWNALLKMKSFIKSIDNNVCSELLLLALLSLVDEISTHRKDGNGVKRKRILPPPYDFTSLKELMVKRINLFLEDINTTGKINQRCTIIESSNIQDYTLERKADIVLTSPPYANCFDYSKVYLTELWVGDFFTNKLDQKTFREQSISSHVHYRWSERNSEYKPAIIEQNVLPLLKTEKLWSDNITNMLSGYFGDMGHFLKNLSRNLNLGSTIGIVVGNSVYGGIPIATDLILTNMAEEFGYKPLKIEVYRQIVASAQQMVRLNDAEKHFVRESLIILKWQ